MGHAALRAGIVLCVAVLCVPAGVGMTDAAETVDVRRERMISEIALMARETQGQTGRGVLDERVMTALRRVDRHRFMPSSQVGHAYENRPLPIGHDQTISQPFIVALMTDLLKVGPGDRVLEVGTGSGYQAAVLAEVAGAVYTIEIVEPLARTAQHALLAAGYRNVHTRTGDGYAGWPEEAPFDGVIVTAAAPYVPQALIDQLKTGGRLVIPLGPRGGVQVLTVVEKDMQGNVTRRKVLDVRFVPLTRNSPK